MALLLSLACSTTKTTTTTTRVPSSSDPNVTEQETTTTTTKEEPGCSGVLSCTVDFVGDVIAFPFRLVGGVVRALF
ncbi:MAG TPA: hypothetical protein VMR31_07645 [Myxococcota bacterium]|nr:hypothetical protein [Myxococcota bacterium]